MKIVFGRNSIVHNTIDDDNGTTKNITWFITLNITSNTTLKKEKKWRERTTHQDPSAVLGSIFIVHGLQRSDLIFPKPFQPPF